MNFQTDRPIYLQVIDDIKRRMIGGELQMGQRLPSTRDLAKEYQINPNTAGRVYREMEADGLCYTARGTGTFVTEDAAVWKTLRASTAGETLDTFCAKMESLGFTLEEIVKLIETRFAERAAQTAHENRNEQTEAPNVRE